MTKTVIDLFSGTGSSTKAFEQHPEWEVFKVEIDKQFDANIHDDVLNVKPSDLPNPDFIWASPPCTKFSIASVSHHWNKRESGYYMPENLETVNSVRLVYHTLYLIRKLKPDYWVMENPRGLLRKILGSPEYTVTYCQFGDDRMKPTDLWAELPDTFEERYCGNGKSCHTSAPRGSDTGTQGRDKIDRARVPKGLSKHILEVIENDLSSNEQPIGEHDAKKQS